MSVTEIDATTGEVTVRPMTPEEEAQRAADEAHATAHKLEWARVAKVDELQAALADSDHWVTRAAEEGRPLEADRVSYREQLRQLKYAAAAATTVEQVAAIEIPPLPDTVATMASRGA